MSSHGVTEPSATKPSRHWERPSGSFLVISFNDNTAELAWAGDCVCLLRQGSFARLGPPPSRGELEAAIIARDANPNYSGAPIAAQLMEKLRASRGAATGAALDVETSGEGKYHSARYEVRPDDEFFLMTDGYAALFDKYGISAIEVVAQINTLGLHGVLAKLRQIEGSDPKGHHYPRFKQGDDATAMWIRASN